VESLSSSISPSIIDTDFVFSGNIFIFHAFDVGDDIHLDRINKMRSVNTIPLPFPKHFKNYHIPLTIELPHPHESTKNRGCKIHNFGALSITYKIPFTDSLHNIRAQFNEIHNEYQEQSILDARSVYKKIETAINKPRFFQTHTSYVVIQVDPVPTKMDVQELKNIFGGLIVSTLRFEQVALSEKQKDEILQDAIGYFRGDLIVIDTETAFVYDKQYDEILDFFEFANVQLAELQYFDRLLDQRLNKMYEGEERNPSWRAYLPFVNMTTSDPIELLGKLKVDISVITERLDNSIKVVGEPYFSELYTLLGEKLDIATWKSGIDRKLSIIHDIQSTYQHRIDIIREDILSVLIIVLIMIEVIIGILK